ncbi:MAG: hypothetical protein WA510_23610 [Acidobacteriaceae bacterium]
MTDLVIYSIVFLTLASAWWREIGFFGEGLLVADLSVQGLDLRREGNSFPYGFDPGTGAYKIAADSLALHPRPRTIACGEARANFSNMHEDIPPLVSMLMNSLLRSLGHSVRKAQFENDVQAIWATMCNQNPSSLGSNLG